MELREPTGVRLEALHAIRLNARRRVMEASIAGRRVHAHGMFGREGDVAWQALERLAAGGPNDWGMGFCAICVNSTCEYDYMSMGEGEVGATGAISVAELSRDPRLWPPRVQRVDETDIFNEEPDDLPL